MKRIVAVIACFLFSLPFLFSQSYRGLLIPETTYNYGTVKVWDNPPAIFTFENTSFDPLYILTPKAGRRVYVEYPRNRIESGEKGEIRVYFYTDQPGSFSEEILLYSSNSQEPIKLQVKGTIKALAENALTQCPDFTSTNRPVTSEYVVEGIVIDKVTRQPIPKSVVRFAGVDAIYTDRNGEFREKIPVGIYVSQAQAEGYRDLNLMVGIKPNMEKIVYELIRTDDQPLEKDTTPETDTVPVIVETPPVDTVIPVLPDETPEFTYREYKANNVVFLVDVSGSMKQFGRIDSLKGAMTQLAGILRSVDNLTLITFATATNEMIADVQGDQKERIIPVIQSLSAKGTTNGVLGIEKAFASALDDFIADGNNQVIVATDGAFNSPNYSENELLGMIRAYKDRGIKLSVIGFSKETKAVVNMKQLAAAGGGNYIQFGSDADVRRSLVEEIKSNSRR
jgi:Mg-chelatase subunit ChlD